MWNTFSVCLACSAERAIEAISLALHSVSHRLKVMRKVDITSQFFWTTFRLVFDEIDQEDRWFEELINLNHLTIFITKFHQKLVEKLSKKIQLSLSHSSLLGWYVTST